MGNSRRIIDIDCKAKSLWTEDNALFGGHQKGVIYYELLKPGETVNTLQTTNDQFEALCEKRRNIKKGNTK